MPGAWVARAPLPIARQEVSVLTLADAMYVLFGFDARGQVVATVELYDPRADEWRSAAGAPVAMHHANAAAIDGRIVVAGFLRGLDFAADGRIFEYDPGEDRWHERGTMPAGTERGASGVAVWDGALYVLGGLRGGARAECSRYTPASGTWDDLPPLPAPLDHMAAGAIEGTIYVAGGRDGRVEGHAAALYALPPPYDTWQARAPMPTSRGGVAAAVRAGRLLVLGGEGNPDHPRGVFPQVESYDPASDTWTTHAPMPTPRHGTGAASLDGRIHVPGGADVRFFGAVRTHEALAVDIPAR
jgi:N-acetylneuraminic acid mutarotase